MTLNEPQLSGGAFRFDFRSLAIPEEELKPIRRNVYHSSGLGYHVFHNFLDPQIAAHMRRFWSELGVAHVHQQLQNSDFKLLANGCPDYYYGEQSGDFRGFINFFWNHPADEVSYAVAMQVQWLRNRVMGRPPQADIFPLNGRAVSYRTAISLRGQVVTRPHRDFDGDDWIRDPSRLQATLFLSTPGVDYSGDGFILETNQGGQVRFGHEVPIACGDLVLWRYCNQHSVQNIESVGAQCGFIRMLFPIEDVANRVTAAETMAPTSAHAAPSPLTRLDILRRLKGTPLGRYVLVPIWHQIRRR